MSATAVDTTGDAHSNVGMRVFKSTAYFFGVSVMAFLFSRKVRLESMPSFRKFARYSWSRTFMLFNLLTTWAFIMSSGVLIVGVGLTVSNGTCQYAVLSCITFYGFAKAWYYMFLIERVYLVWRGTDQRTRKRSIVYVGCVLLSFVYIAVTTTYLFMGRIAHITTAGTCYIGLTRGAALGALGSDVFLNVILTSLFVWPLFRLKFRNSRLKKLTVWSLWAAVISLATSSANMASVAIMHGEQAGWGCLFSCGLDIFLNAVVLCCITPNVHRDRELETPTSSRQQHPPPQAPVAGPLSFVHVYRGDAHDGLFADADDEDIGASSKVSGDSGSRDSALLIVEERRPRMRVSVSETLSHFGEGMDEKDGAVLQLPRKAYHIA